MFERSCPICGMIFEQWGQDYYYHLDLLHAPQAWRRIIPDDKNYSYTVAMWPDYLGYVVGWGENSTEADEMAYFLVPELGSCGIGYVANPDTI